MDAGLSTRTFEIASPDRALEVGLRLTESPARQFSFCGDSTGSAPGQLWRATKGTVAVDVTPRGVGGRIATRYRVTIRIDGADFVSADGVRVIQVQPIVLTIFGQ